MVGIFPHDGNVFTPGFLRKIAQVTERIRRVPGANPALIQSIAAPQVKLAPVELAVVRSTDRVPSTTQNPC